MAEDLARLEGAWRPGANPDAEFDTPAKAYAEAERRIEAARVSNATELDVQLRFLQAIPPSIADCTALQTLSLDGTRFADLAPLSACTALQHLSLDRTGVADLAPLSACTALQTLSLAGTRVADLAPLSACTALKTLSLDRTGVADLAPLSACTALQTLSLAGTRVADLAPLSACTALRHLWLTGTRVADLAPLAACTDLQHLSLADTRVADLAPVSACTALESLWLDGTGVADLAPLSACTALKTLSLTRTGVADLAPLAACTALADAAATIGTPFGLRFDDTPVSKRHPFSDFIALKHPASTVETINYLRRQQGLPLHIPQGYVSPLTDTPLTEALPPTAPDPADIPSQLPLGRHFGGPLNEPIHELPDPPEGPLRDTADQRALYGEIKREASRLGEACAGNNRLGELKSDLGELAALMGEAVPTLQPHLNAFWFAADRLRAHEAMERDEIAKELATKDRFSQAMPADIYRRLGTLTRRLNEFVVMEPQLDARDRRAAGPDAAQASAEALDAAKAYVDAMAKTEGLQDAQAIDGLKKSAAHAAARHTPRAEEFHLESTGNNLKELLRRAASETQDAAKSKPAKDEPSWPVRQAKKMAGKAVKWGVGVIAVEVVVQLQFVLKDFARTKFPPQVSDALVTIIDKICEIHRLLW